MNSRKARMDLRPLSINNSTSKNEKDLRIAHLKWLEDRDVLDLIFQLSSLELEDQAEVLDENELVSRRNIIEQAKLSGMRRSDGSLSSAFVCWYENFCVYDGHNAIHYSPATFERGDHPHWAALSAVDQPLPEDTETITPVAHATVATPTQTPKAAGGQLGRKLSYNFIVDFIIDDILERRPTTSPADAWKTFFDEAPDWRAPDDISVNLQRVTFEPREPSIGQPYLTVTYYTSKLAERRIEYGITTFERRLRKRRSVR